MPAYVAIPKLGMAMTEATLVEWKVGEGARVERGDVILTIETEKTNWDVEALASGYLHIVVEADATVPVGRVVGLIAETEEELAALASEPPRELYTAAPEPEAAAPERPEPDQAPRATRRRGEIKISPLARRLAAEHGLDPATIDGTGPEGRIVREDVERAIAAQAAGTRPPAAAAAVHEGKRVAATIPLKGMRRTIAEHMQRSLAVSAQLTYMGETEMTAVVEFRRRLAADGLRVTYTDILVLALARALRDIPIMNASVVGDEIKIWDDVNIGVAVALERGLEGGLIVPVVRNADQKSLADISRELASLVERARAGRLLPDDVSGGTFTLTNLGTVSGGWVFGTPIINQPQAAVMGTGAVTDRPVVRDGQVVVRPMLPYSLTFDHRVIDGAPAAQFAARFSELLETPERLAP